MTLAAILEPGMGRSAFESDRQVAAGADNVVDSSLTTEVEGLTMSDPSSESHYPPDVWTF